MKVPLAVDFYPAFSFLAQPLGAPRREENNNDHGNRNLSLAFSLPSRPVSAPPGRGPVRFNDSRLPSSLNDWLASKEALIIR
jgi:hypothetical protein